MLTLCIWSIDKQPKLRLPPLVNILYWRYRMKRNELFAQLISLLRNSLLSEDFLEEFRIEGHFIRRRKLSLYQMVMFLLFHSRASLDVKLERLMGIKEDFEFPKVSKQALSKARYGIQYQLFQELLNLCVDFYYRNLPDTKLWMDRYHLFAVDGSDLEVPSSVSSFEEFGKMSDRKNPSLFWSMALASVLYDVTGDIIVDAALEKQFYGERELAVQHLSRLTDLGISRNAVVIFDRGYYSADVYEECVNSGCFCLMRMKSSSSLCLQEKDDAITSISAPDGTKISCRIIRTVLDTGETEYLITNIMDREISPDQFKELYFERWKIETKYLEFKDRWMIEEFTGTGALAVRQDFYITLLYSNLAAIIKAAADDVIQKTANPVNVYQYRARRTYIISTVLLKAYKWLFEPFLLADVDELIEDASKKRSQIQPGRTRKRKRRTRARKHFNNQKNNI